MANNTPFLNTVKLCSLLAAICLSTNATAAEVYKWVDEQGNTYYSDKRPNNTQSTSIKVQSRAAAPRSSAQSQANALDERAAKALQAQQEMSQKDAREKEIKEKCETLRKNLKTIAQTSRIKVSEGDETRFLSPEEIQAKKEHHEKQIKEFCQ